MSPKVSKTKTLQKPFQIHYCKYGRNDSDKTLPKIIDLEDLKTQYSCDSSYNPFDISKLQLYTPMNKLFFEMSDSVSDRIGLNHSYHFINMDQVFDVSSQKIIQTPSFIKYSPLLDPVRYMIGKYETNRNLIRELPSLSSTETTCISKILSYNNASYIDCFFSYLTSKMLTTHKFLHGVDFHGTYLGIQKKFRFCATDDIDYLRNSDFFNDHVGKLFYIEIQDSDENVPDEFANIVGSRGNKNKLKLSTTKNVSEISMTILEGCEIIPMTNENLDRFDTMEEVYKNNNSCSDFDNNSESSNDSEENYSSENEESNNNEKDDDEDWETEDEDKNSDSSSLPITSNEEEIFGYINDFPIQMICLEKCEGTLDELFVKDEIDPKTAASALFQVIMSLLAYQKSFKFTHNDLHTNNIMWIKTDLKHLTYRFSGKVYNVPTYGKIFKLIDFGRAIYRFQDKQFCSDSFAPGGDAATQYNFEPFFNRNKPRLEPNYSFDLCRLGSSIFDFIMDVDTPISKMDDLQKTIHRWCLDDNKKNVLYKKNGEERYPNFKLYKMIARTVHEHTPEAQLEFPYFKQFLTKSNTGEKVMMDLDELPSY
jgi:hypothetical protein